MPIAVKDYTWRETEAEVDIVLPLKAVKPSKVDILSTERYLKVSYPPYLFEVHLQADVVAERCSAKVGNGVIKFRLVKKDPSVWGSLGSAECEDRRALGKRRAEAVERAQEVAREEAELRAKTKREEEQFAIRQQMKLEQEERERIEKEKQNERDRTQKELQKWEEEKAAKALAKREAAVREKKAHSAFKSKNKTNASDIWKEKPKKKPPLRASGTIEVHFTPRAFPTAARESREEEEQEWLTKQAAARRITQPEKDEDGDINERNPEFLKDKGVGFFQKRNYEAALNAFSEAVQLNPYLPQLYANRAACFLALERMEECVADCCRALELYFPVVPSNHIARAKVFVRRGSAYAQIGQLDLAVQDYEAALELLPGDQELQEDCTRLRQAKWDEEQGGSCRKCSGKSRLSEAET